MRSLLLILNFLTRLIQTHKIEKMKIPKLLVLFLSIFLISCEDKTDETAALELEFVHKAGQEDFEYNRIYQNEAGNEFSLSLWRTYISEVKLIKTSSNGGSEINLVPDSYHLIEPNDGNRFSLTLSGIPAGNYAAIEFYIGVVGEENFSGQTVGDLDPSNNMAWNWTTGYKFIRMDGEFQDLSGNRRGVVVHIGTAKNLKRQKFDFQDQLNLSGNSTKISFELDLLEAFQNPHTINFEELSDFQFNNEADLIAENYEQGFIKLLQ